MAQLEALRVTRQEKVLAKGTHAKVLENLKMQMQSIWGSAKMKPELESVLKEVEKLSEVAKTQELMLHKINNDITIKQSKAMEETTLADWLAASSGIGNTLENKNDYLNGQIQGSMEKLGSLRQLKEHSVTAQGQLNEMRERLTDAQTKHDGYTRLFNYYTTIPVMIMEGAVPTLEAATNSILEKISPSGMRIRLETQRALKSSDRLGETLDILVRDVFGEKPYENYSGGEKFRLDLALRFGLSQLLMNRAGSKMETLIIDEGLGSLDQDGLALLRECLSKLESAFGLILVISHVEGIQGTFEQQIMVEKNAIGSEIKVL
jgi:exonuclease SbcC